MRLPRGHRFPPQRRSPPITDHGTVNPPLNDVEVRILGALAEKCVTTPDNYPLSLSALVAACNQATNREPVMHLDEEQVSEAIVALRRRSLLRAIQPAGSRVTKFQHLLNDALDLDAREVALLCVLMLRGAQTPGELHARTTRLADFADRTAVEATLDALIARAPEALVSRIPRRAGQKEDRFAHLLSGEVVTRDDDEAIDAPHPLTAPSAERIATLESAVAELRTELAELRAQFTAFREEFR